MNKTIKLYRIGERIMTSKYWRKRYLVCSPIGRLLPSERYLKYLYKLQMGKELNLDNPQSFNEKLQWLKLYDRNPLYTTLVDKYAVRGYIKEKLGEEYLIPLVGGPYASVDEIDFDRLPDQFVLKCTHDSASVIICRDRNTFDIAAAKKKLNKALKVNYFYVGREWPYKNVKPQIIAEKYMVDESGVDLKDYKIFNFAGKPKIIQVDYDRFVEHKRNLYTTDWEYIEAAIQYPSDSDYIIRKPEVLDEMLDLAGRLSAGMPHVRTDFYCIDGRVYFGEFTFYPECGIGEFMPEQLGIKMGEWIEISGGGILRADNYCLYFHKVDIGMDSEEHQLAEYKFFCFHGQPKYVLVCRGEAHGEGRTNDFYDMDFCHIPVTLTYSNARRNEEKPEQYEKMIDIAKILSCGIPQVRIDLYLINEKIYFGEITFFHDSGFCQFHPDKWDNELGKNIHLPSNHFNGVH